MKLLAPGVALLMLLPQEQRPVFRTGVSTVPIYASVSDRAGQVIRNLSKDDFTVFDEGRRQELTVFSAELQPITAVLLIDSSASMALTMDMARHAAEQFILRMLPGDRARVGSFSDSVRFGPPFTGNRDALLRSIRDDLRIGNPTRLWDAIGQTMDAFADIGGRRVLILFTDGDDTASTLTGRVVLERARAEEFMIYAVQIRSRVSPLVEQQILGPIMPRPRGRGDPTPTEVLRGMATETGGTHFVLSRNDDVNATFTEVAGELRHQYLLGFVPDKTDGKVHELQVRVKLDGASVRARRYYLARLPGAPQ